MTFIQSIRNKLADGSFCVILPEGEDDRVLSAAVLLGEVSPAIKCIALGPPDQIQASAARLNISLTAIDILDPTRNPDEAALAEFLQQGRPDMKLSTATRLVRKPLYCGGMLLKSGRGDAMVGGVTCPTARVIEAALMTVGLAPGAATPSSAFMMLVPEGTGERRILFADCAVNTEPTPEMLADIAIASARTWIDLTGEDPRIAFLSFSTHGSAKHVSAERVREAVRIARHRAPQYAFDGEMQADAALSPRVASLKIRGESPVAGRANVLVFPDLNAANIGYKLVQYLGGASALGPILQGFAKPVSDLSRGATVQDIVETVLLTLGRVAAPQD